MNFKPLTIRETKFHRSLFGYRAGDIDDFVKRVEEDYETYQVKVSELVVSQNEVEKLKETIKGYDINVQQLTSEIKQLKHENDRLSKFENEIQELEEKKKIAKKAADALQEEAEILLDKAKGKAEGIIRDAESEKLNRILNLQIKINELIDQRGQLDDQIADKKKEYFELRLQYEDVLATKERLTKEAQILGQEFQSLRNKLIEKYAGSLDEFLKENQLFSPSMSDESANKVTALTAKRIG